MNDELRMTGSSDPAGEQPIGEPVASLIREAYTPPDAAAWPDIYWSGLEHRIMARVAESERGWWTELVSWARVGLAAAAVIFALASVVSRQIGLPQRDQMAYEVVGQPDLSFASDEPFVTQYVAMDNDAAGLRYFLSSR